MHDPRVGRFFAVDPLAPKYPHNSPYAFSENRVIDGVELEGLEFKIRVIDYDNTRGLMIVVKDRDICTCGAFVNPKNYWMNYLKKHNVVWISGEDEYYKKKKKYKVYKERTFFGIIPSGDYEVKETSIPPSDGTLVVKRQYDENRLEFITAEYTPDYKSRAVKKATNDIFVGVIGFFASGGSEILSGGTTTSVSVPGMVYSGDKAVGGIIKLVDIYHNDNYDNSDKRLVRATFEIVGGKNGTRVYDLGNLYLSVKGIFTIPKKCIQVVNKIVKVEQILKGDDEE